MAKTPEMNADFARWYVDAFMDDGQTRAQRWKGVVDTAAAANFHTVEVLVRYAFATTAPADGWKNGKLAETHQAVLATISGNGSPMVPAASRRELQVLTAAVLTRLFYSMPDAAIVVLNASFEGKRKYDLPMDLPGLAKLALVEFARKKHARPDTKAFEIVTPKLEFEVSTEAMASMTSAQWKSELDRLRDAARMAGRAIVDGQNRVAKLLARQISLGEEELQMLWWLIGGHSNVADAPFDEVAAPLKPLVFGEELGQLTQVSPGPASMKALLSRAGIGGEAGLPDKAAVFHVQRPKYFLLGDGFKRLVGYLFQRFLEKYVAFTRVIPAAVGRIFQAQGRGFPTGGQGVLGPVGQARSVA